MEQATLSAKPSQKPKLLDQVRYALRVLHYSYKTEKAYIPWIYQFVVFHSPREIEFDLARFAASSLLEKIKDSITFQLSHGVNKLHPAEMGEKEIREFLTHLVVKQKIAASTQNQALCAVIFLYREVPLLLTAGFKG